MQHAVPRNAAHVGTHVHPHKPSLAAALERAWHPYFNIFSANTRMSYAEPLNRPLFLALFKQMQACCSPTAMFLCRQHSWSHALLPLSRIVWLLQVDLI